MCIFAPLDRNYCCWVSPSECVWKAPQKLVSKYALECLYKADEGFTNFNHLSSFFTDVLGIGNCDPAILLNELGELKALDKSNFDTISGVYAGLQSMKSRITGSTMDEVR